MVCESLPGLTAETSRVCCGRNLVSAAVKTHPLSKFCEARVFTDKCSCCRKPREKVVLPRRSSLRIQNKDPDGLELPPRPVVTPLFEEDIHVSSVNSCEHRRKMRDLCFVLRARKKTMAFMALVWTTPSSTRAVLVSGEEVG